MSIDRMRNAAAEYALALECDFLLFIDDDILVHENTIESLVQANRDIVMADTLIRGYPFHSMSFKVTEVKSEDSCEDTIKLEHFDDILEHVDENGIADCAAVGFSCCLIKTELLKRLPKPYFCTSANSTEDVYFCLNAKRMFPETSIAVDTKVPTFHRLDPLYITRQNVEKMKKFYEPEPVKDESQFRGEEYYKKCQSLISDQV